jgi:hypothetical protein
MDWLFFYNFFLAGKTLFQRYRRSYLRDAGGAVELGVIHQVWKLVGGHLCGGVGLEERLQLFRVVHILAQPESEGVGMKNDRHSFMDGGYKFVGCSGQDGKRFKLAAARRFPCFPKTGKTHGCLVRQMDEVWLFRG